MTESEIEQLIYSDPRFWTSVRSDLRAAVAARDAARKAADPVDHPAHYNVGKIEVIDAIEDWRLGFNLGNVVKYVARAGEKDPAKTVEDLRKATWYLDREIKRLTGKP